MWLRLIFKDHQSQARLTWSLHDRGDCRYTAECGKVSLLAMVILLSASLSIRGFGQELEAAQQFVQSANSSSAAQKLLREGRELVGERKWAAAKAKFNDIIRAYPRDKNLDAALYWLAFCLKHQERPREADQTLERLIKEYPRSEWSDDARALRLEIAGAMGNLDAAHEILERAQESRERAQEAQDRAQEVRERSQETQERAQEARERAQTLRERNRRTLHTDDPNEALRLIALQSLFQADSDRAMSVAVGFLNQDSKAGATIQEAALGLIARHGGEKAWPTLIDTARNQTISESVREQAIYWIAHQNRERAAEALTRLYDGEKTAELKERLLYWLAHSDDARARAKVDEIARADASPELRERAVYWIAHRDGSEASDTLARLYDEQKEEETKERILYWLGQRGGKAGLQKLLLVARNDSSQSLRERAIYYLAGSKDPEAIKFLEQIFK
jgi:hypothetical protein